MAVHPSAPCKPPARDPAHTLSSRPRGNRPMNDSIARKIKELRGQIGHPIIDADGHLVEFIPAVRDRLTEEGGESLASDFDTFFSADQLARTLDVAARRSLGLHRLSWWAFPTETRDRATALLPRLLMERLPELGIDYAIIYPTFGLMVPHIDDADLRAVTCRAFNRYYADCCSGLSERLTPAALVPMHTPEEACRALDHSISTLGFKAAVFAGLVARPLPGQNEARAARWIDSFGPDAPFAYDPVWQRCLELNVAPTFHSSAMGWGSRTSLTNYVFNHLGNFATGGEATCRSIFLAGVANRFPDLRFAFLEGGIGWALNLYSDLIGHYEKRGGVNIQQFNPNRTDAAELTALFEKYASPAVISRIDELKEGLRIMSDPLESPEGLDEFEQSGARSSADIQSVFERQFFFGCEADDPMTPIAFDDVTAPGGARLPALFSSDIGHWDVPDMSGVVLEAWESVESGRLTEADFQRFTFQNAVELYAGNNASFFEGTAVEPAARAIACGRR
ncbi:MAG: hypothetical protein CBC48_14175 [bacterium TMED88]|nr:amidohydrolase [Deltaproteobacteria bacterium]OUV27618.1 MAG: hypothetical protein CBC48_14175 [bacterium TMED88]